MEFPQLQCSDKVVDVPVVQFIDGYGRRCDHAATSGLATVKVPQTQFIAGVGGHSSSQQRRSCFQQGMAAMKVFWTFLGHFSRSSRSSGVERQFSEPSMTKSSSLSRALAQ